MSKKFLIPFWTITLTFGVCVLLAWGANFYPFSGDGTGDGLIGGGSGAVDAVTSTTDKDGAIAVLNDDSIYGNAAFFFGLDADGAGTEALPWLIDSGDGGNEDWELCDIYAMKLWSFGATGELALNDINAAGAALADKHAGSIKANMTTTTEDSEISDITITSQISGEVTIAEWDGSDEAWVLGDSTTGEDLIFDFEAATDNEVTVTSNSGVVSVDFGTIDVQTDTLTSSGNVAGATYGSDSTISDAELLTLDDGATTEILVGGGAGSAPVWTTVTGTGAPVMATAPTFVTSITIGSAGIDETELEILDGATLTTAEANYLDIATLGTGAASKAVVLDGSGNYTAPAGTWDLSGVTGITLAAGEVVSADIASIVTSTAWVGAGMVPDGTQCAAASDVQINSGPYQQTIICADNDASTLYGNVQMPDSWDASNVTFELAYIQTAADTSALNGDVTIQCRGAAETVNNTWESEVAMDDAGVTGSNAVDHLTSGNVSGTCVAGDHLYWRWQMDATGTTTAVATLHFVGMKMEYTSNVGD